MNRKITNGLNMSAKMYPTMKQGERVIFSKSTLLDNRKPKVLRGNLPQKEVKINGLYFSLHLRVKIM